MTDPIYLDYNVTTPLDPAVFEAMVPYLRDHFGNPSSDHVYGYRTRAAVQTAREQLAALLDAAPEEAIFTGGGSEANNLALKGVAYRLHTLNLSFPGLNAATLLALVRDRVACSTGSACHARQAAPSTVLPAMGRNAGLAAAALRLSLGWATTEQEVLTATAAITSAVHDLT